MRYHLTLVRKLLLKSLQTIIAEEDMEKREPSCKAGGSAN